jgi:hypothetical protein
LTFRVHSKGLRAHPRDPRPTPGIPGMGRGPRGWVSSWGPPGLGDGCHPGGPRASGMGVILGAPGPRGWVAYFQGRSPGPLGNPKVYFQGRFLDRFWTKKVHFQGHLLRKNTRFSITHPKDFDSPPGATMFTIPAKALRI